MGIDSVFENVRAARNNSSKFTFPFSTSRDATITGTVNVSSRTESGRRCQTFIRKALSLIPQQTPKRDGPPISRKPVHKHKPRPERFFIENTAVQTIEGRPTAITTCSAPPFTLMLHGTKPLNSEHIVLGKQPTSKLVQLTEKREYKNPIGLLPFQRDVVDACFDFLTNVGGCLAVVPCGMGKTEIMAALVAMVGVVTVIVAPKLVLVHQIIMKLMSRVPGLMATEWTSCRKDCSGEVIVTTPKSMDDLRTALRAKYGVEAGLLIVDEVHHCPAKLMFQSMANWGCPRVGLTATLRRGDGFEKVIPLMMGPLAARVKRPWTPGTVRLEWVRTSRLERARTWADTITQLTGHKDRNDDIIAIVTRCLARVQRKQADGRVLILTDRRDHAIQFFQVTKETQKSGLFIGNQTQKQRDFASNEAEIIWSTMSMAYEGLDLSNIAAVVFVTRKREIEQAAGRGLRMGSLPKCVDFVVIGDANSKGHVEFMEQMLDQLAYLTVDEGWPLFLPFVDRPVADAFIPTSKTNPSAARAMLDRKRIRRSALLFRAPLKITAAHPRP